MEKASYPLRTARRRASQSRSTPYTVVRVGAVGRVCQPSQNKCRYADDALCFFFNGRGGERTSARRFLFLVDFWRLKVFFPSTFFSVE